MRKTFNIKVEQKHIDNARTNSFANCMVAEAIREQLGASSLAVTSESIRFNLSGYRYRFDTPLVAGYNICQFDDDKTDIKPFQFKLQNLITLNKVIKKVSNGKSKHSNFKPTKSEYCVRRYHGTKTLVKNTNG